LAIQQILKIELIFITLVNNGLQKNRIPFILVYFEKFNDKKDALRREKQIKSFKGEESFKKLIAGV